MHSDGNSFCGDVVLDSFKMIYSDKDSNYDQKYEKEIFWNVIMKILIWKWLKKMLL